MQSKFHRDFEINSSHFNERYKELNLECNFLFDMDIIVHVIPYLKEHPEIESLKLSSNEIEVEGAKALVNALSELKNIKKLNIRHNKLGTEGAMVFADNETLLKLDISFNKIGSKGAIALAKNNFLKKLVVEFDFIEAEGAKALALNKNLSSLDISTNYIKISGVVALAANFGLSSNVKANERIGNEIFQSIREKLINAFTQGATIGALRSSELGQQLPRDVSRCIGFFLGKNDGGRLANVSKQANQIAQEEKERQAVIEGKDQQFEPQFYW